VSQSEHTAYQLALIRGYSAVTLGYLHSAWTGTPLYLRDGQVMEDVIIRGVLSGSLE